jgi:phage tail-like protein
MARRDADPFPNFRFALELNDVQVAGFSECSGLNVEAKVYEYREGGRNDTTLKFPDTATYGNVTLKRGVTRATELLDWQLDVVNGTFATNKRGDDVSVAIVLLEETGADPPVVRRWTLARALPVKWVGPDFKATGNEVAIEALEIAHEGITQG